MRLILFLALGCAALAVSAPASARPWNNAQIGDLLAEATRAPAEGLAFPTSEASLAELLESLAYFDPAFEIPRDAAAETLFRLLARDYAQGAVAPTAVDDNWFIEPPPPDYATLDAAIDAGEAPSALLQNLLPQSQEYRALRDELARLVQSDAADTQHIESLRANMERWRWLPRTWPARRVEVRIAEFKLNLIQEGQTLVTHDIIVGRPPTPTHVFSAQIESVTLNPDWEPPNSIAYGELLPRFRRHPGAAAAEGFEAIDSAGQAIDAASVDWTARPFPYRIRQRPGPQNALGSIRFNLPNPFAIYLHDTPSRNLFDRTDRALSHGCVRVKDPVLLGEELFNAPAWTAAELQSAIDSGVMQQVPLTDPVPVFFLYLTATTGADGAIVYLDDVYHRDDAIVRALNHNVGSSAREAHIPVGMCPS